MPDMPVLENLNITFPPHRPSSCAPSSSPSTNTSRCLASDDERLHAFLEDDLAAAHTLEVEDFFRVILGVSNTWVDAHNVSLKDLADGSEYRDTAARYHRSSASGPAFQDFVRKAGALLERKGLLQSAPTITVVDGISGTKRQEEFRGADLLAVVGEADLEHTFASVSLGEVKPPSATRCLGLDVQLANAAFSIMSYGSWTSRVLGAIVREEAIQLLYFDHSIIVQSEPFDITRQPMLFFTMLCGVGNFCRQKSRSSGPCIEFSSELEERQITLPGGSVLQLGEIIHQQPGLVGRATCVVRVTQTHRATPAADWSDKKLIAKISWPPKERTSEVDVIELARERAVETGELWVLDHLPAVLECQEWSAGENGLSARLAGCFGRWHTPRVLRMVVEEELTPLVQLRHPVELGIVINDAFRCYRWLYEKCTIAHHDISHSNVMFHVKDGVLKGVLNDFDMASVGLFRDALQGTPSSGTGTRLFMAIELLGSPPSPHYYRHDLESLMYVMLWHASRYIGNGVSPYERWGDPCIDLDVLEAYKIRFVHEETPLLSQGFEVLRPWIERLQTLLRRGFQARRVAKKEGVVEFDDETLGGVFTFETFWEACEEELKKVKMAVAGPTSMSARL
ncbi:hypothetical protein EUX98_g4233 [Antrodiella citrinella]|uniref:Fungal-type protein kinase domain-containing protein n=1 Tax=Antrodiella citrinella TaxID=2447956 RepID=A0A4V3XIN8_9APHY|nr:hypothetical protein EUX98_g4233 [Antrodiella citrinella]